MCNVLSCSWAAGLCPGREGIQLVSWDDLPLLQALFHCSPDEEREHCGDSSFLSWQIQVFRPTKTVTTPGRADSDSPRCSQVQPGGGRFPSPWPSSSRQLQSAAHHWAAIKGEDWLDGGRREASCRRAPRGKCRVLPSYSVTMDLLEPGTWDCWDSLQVGTYQGKLYSFHSQHISHLGFTIALISRPDCLGPIIMSEECCETSELSSWPGYWE